MRRQFHDPLDIAILQSRGRHKLRRGAFGTDDIYPIQHQHVEVRIQIQRAAEAAIRRPIQLGQKPRPLHENATVRLVLHSEQRSRRKP